MHNIFHNLERIPYADILQKNNFNDLIYQLRKILEFIANDGEANLAKSIFNVNAINKLEYLIAKDNYNIDLYNYKSRSFVDSHIRLYYIDKEFKRDIHDVASISYTTKIKSTKSEKPYTFNTFIFGREVENDEYIINLLAYIVRQEINLRLYEETGYTVLREKTDFRDSQFERFIDTVYYINKYIKADFALHLYDVYFSILDQILDLKYDQFDLIYDDSIGGLPGEREIIQKIYNTVISNQPLYTDEMYKLYDYKNIAEIQKTINRKSPIQIYM